jgi:hypothetical protein
MLFVMEPTEKMVEKHNGGLCVLIHNVLGRTKSEILLYIITN